MHDTPYRLLKRHFPWVLIVFFGTLSVFAASNLRDKLNEWERAQQMRMQIEVNALISLAVHELQKERGISSGHVASGGDRFAAPLRAQRAQTDPVLAALQRALPASGDARGGLMPAVTVVRDIAHLRHQVSALELNRDEAVERYNRMIEALFAQMTGATRIADGSLLRAQLALIAFLQAKEMAGQERALLTTLLVARNFESRPLREALARIRTQEAIHIQQFLGLADEGVRDAYWDMMERPAVQQADVTRRKVVHIAEAPWFMGDGLPSPESWFEVSTRKIDAMKAFEGSIGQAVERSALDYERAAWHDLALSSGLVLASFLLALIVLLQLRRSQRLAEKDLHLAASVFRNSVEAIVITDRRATIVQANAAFCRMTGYAGADVIGQSMSLLKSDRHDSLFFAAMWEELVAHGSWEGEVWNRRKDGSVYPAQLSVVAVREPQGAVDNYIAMILDLSQRKRSEALIEHLRTFDPLTGLLTREAWRETVDAAVLQAGQGGGQVAVLEFGLDRFKLINESLGHAVGDKVLVEAAARIRRALPRDCPAARLGGDRYSVLLEEGALPASVATICEWLLAAFALPIVVDGHELNISASIGVALYPADAPDAPTLLMNAESAMNRAKEGGRGSYKFYCAQMNGDGVRLLALERMLRLALARNEFSLHYQPQVSARDGRLLGVEALLRWHNPELGTVSPVQFIPIAEETGLIVAIGAWVLRTACQQSRHWSAQLGCPLPVAVNLSARQFMQEDLVAMVAAVLEETGLPGAQLELEITEGLLVVDPRGAAETLHQLRALGVRVAIDDFGTGYSSLAYLKTFPLDRLKMDRSFVRDLQANESDKAIARTIVALAHNLGIEVVAEGVETVAQRDFLAATGCQVLQGYLHGRPVLPAELERRIGAGELTLSRDTALQ